MADTVSPASSSALLEPQRPAGPAKSLRISILKGNRAVVQVVFPAYAIANLTDLVPEEAKPHIKASSLDIEQLVADFTARGCPRGELFTIERGESIVRAWME